MKLNKEHLQNIYINLNAITHLNFVFSEYNSNKYIRLNSYDLPQIIREAELETFPRMLDRLSHTKTNAVCYFENNLKLRYIAVGVFDSLEYIGAIIMGPYLNVAASEKLIQDVLTGNGISMSLRHVLFNFYTTLPVLSTVKENAVSNITLNLIESPMKKSSPITIEEKITQDSFFNYSLENYEIDVEKVRQSYKAEAELLHYISIGDEKRALQMISMNPLNIIERFPEAPLRNLKNLSITMNTLFRKAIQTNSVDPFFIHTVSDKYAIRIEEAQSTTQLYNLIPKMIKSYCGLVNEYSNSGYSALVSRTINHIRLNFDRSITLSNIAQELYVHPNYLSKKFKDETGFTLTEYINQVRVKEAIFMLTHGDLSIADIAYSVGYNDKKYFSKTFKKIIGKSPSEYRNYGGKSMKEIEESELVQNKEKA